MVDEAMKSKVLCSEKDAAILFRETYLPGFDCALSTLRNTLAFYGYRFSNAMVLGLSGSFCFLYRDRIADNIPYFLLTGISHNSIESLPTSLNSYLYKDKKASNADMEAFFDGYFNRGLPVHIAVNRPRLLSFIHKKPIGLIEQALDIGYHYITVVQRNKEKGSYTIFETDDSHPYDISETELRDVWYYDCGPKKRVVVEDLACDGKWYAFFPPKNISILLPELMRFSLLKVVNNFLYPYSDDTGLVGLETLRTKALGWSDRDPMELCTTILLMKAMEFNLTGGGFGRKLIGRYLREVSECLADSRLTEIARMFGATAKQWETFVNALFGAVSFDFDRGSFNSDRAAVSALVKRAIGPLIDAERQQMEALRNWTKDIR